MRLSCAIFALFLGSAAGLPGTAIEMQERVELPGFLDDIGGLEALEFAHLANPTRHMVDEEPRPLRDLARPEMPHPIELPQTTSYAHGVDNLYLLSVPRINLRGGTIPRFLTLEIRLNCGSDVALVESLDDLRPRLLDVLEPVFGPLSFEEVRHPSQKNDLREELIIRINQELQTQSIKDIYFSTFIVF